MSITSHPLPMNILNREGIFFSIYELHTTLEHNFDTLYEALVKYREVEPFHRPEIGAFRETGNGDLEGIAEIRMGNSLVNAAARQIYKIATEMNLHPMVAEAYDEEYLLTQADIGLFSDDSDYEGLPCVVYVFLSPDTHLEISHLDGEYDAAIIEDGERMMLYRHSDLASTVESALAEMCNRHTTRRVRQLQSA